MFDQLFNCPETVALHQSAPLVAGAIVSELFDAGADHFSDILAALLGDGGKSFRETNASASATPSIDSAACSPWLSRDPTLSSPG